MPTPLIDTALVDAFPPEMLTPISTIVQAIDEIIDNPSISGQAAECSGSEVLYRPFMPYGNEAAEYLQAGKYQDQVDRRSLALHSQVKGREVEELLK